METHRAHRVNLCEGGLRITEPPGREVKEVVALVSEPGQVPALVPAFMGAVYGQGLVLLNVL